MNPLHPPLCTSGEGEARDPFLDDREAGEGFDGRDLYTPAVGREMTVDRWREIRALRASRRLHDSWAPVTAQQHDNAMKALEACIDEIARLRRKHGP